MRTIRFLTRGESSDFWPEMDQDGNPVIDMKSGQLAGRFRVTYFAEGEVLTCPATMADNMIALGYAEEVREEAGAA